MSFKNFFLQVIIRLVLVATGLFGILYFSYIMVNYIRLFFSALYTLIVLVELFYYIIRSNKDTRNFLEAIIHNDFTQKYSAERKGKSFGTLYETFNQVNQKFLEVSQQEASEYQYITTLVHQLSIGVLSYDNKGRIHLVNNALKTLLSKDELINLESIKRVSPGLHEAIINTKVHENQLTKIALNGKEYHFSLTVSEFKLRSQEFRLVSIQDLRGTLDKNEMVAWQKLIRVLTHEIMNSVAPITSLSSTLNHMVTMSQKSKVPLDTKQLQSLHDGLDAIENRSGGLMNFTQAYRSLTRIPLPNIKPVDGELYFQRINSLFQPTLAGTGIQFELVVPRGSFTLHFDPDLMEQAIINLLKNAKEAVIDHGGHKVILRVSGTKATNQWVIEVEDDGGGIPTEIEEQIFIPFYTTKNNGSGIGLSLVKQIVHAHNAEVDLKVNKEMGKTTFSIQL